MLCSSARVPVIEVDDKCEAIYGLKHATRLKANSKVDVFVALPCSLGKLCTCLS